ncbi:MAG: TonB-dependent receptor [Candidatus Tantalella remota]|nr:TonB-dependent receptor [Candidatus Tantalella remota]
MRKLIVITVLGLLVFGGQVHASGEDKETVLDVILKPVKMILAPIHGGELLDVVTKPAEELLMPVFSFEEEMVTPAGFEERAIDYPGNVTVITEKDIERSNAKYVYELLRKEAGIYVSDYTQSGKTVVVDMRGFGETSSRNVLVMMDGRRLNEVDISGTDWTQVPIENVERIEIIRGSGSVLYGDNAAAGVINIITKRGKEGHHFKGGADFGSYGYRNYYGRINGAEEFASYNAIFKQEETDGYRLNGGYDGCNFMADMTIFPVEWLNVDFSGGYHKDWYGLPSGLQRSEIDQIGYRGSTTPNDKVKTETTFIKVTPVIRLTAGGMEHALEVDAWGRKKRVNMINWAELPAWGIPWYPSWDSSQIDTVAGSVKYTNKYNGDNFKNTLVTGVDMFSAQNRLLTVTPQWATYNQLKIIKRTLGLYVSDNIKLFERVIINAGFRQQWAKYIFDQAENAGRYESQTPDEQAFEVGVEYKYAENGGVYGRFSRSFRFPATDEFYSRWSGLNADLKHQKADTWEVGVKDANSKYLQPMVNVFWMESDNEIFYDPTVGTFGDNENYDKIKRFGVETGAVSDPFDWLNLYFNYTYLNAKFEGGAFVDKRVPMVPEHKIAWGMNVSPSKFVEFNFNSVYISEQYSINDQENRMAELKRYFICNGKVVLKYKGFESFFGINNIFDTRYAEIAASNVAGTVTDLHPAPERNYIFGFSMRF